jgi:hypothetical protein
MSKDERIVREAWEDYSIMIREFPNSSPYWIYLGEEFCTGPHKTEAKAWRAAAEFTTQRQEQIRQVGEEIKIVRNELSLGRDRWNSPEFIRILAREQAALAELQRGMKEEPHDTTE